MSDTTFLSVSGSVYQFTTKLLAVEYAKAHIKQYPSDICTVEGVDYKGKQAPRFKWDTETYRLQPTSDYPLKVITKRGKAVVNSSWCTHDYLNSTPLARLQPANTILKTVNPYKWCAVVKVKGRTGKYFATTKKLAIALCAGIAKAECTILKHNKIVLSFKQ